MKTNIAMRIPKRFPIPSDCGDCIGGRLLNTVAGAPTPVYVGNIDGSCALGSNCWAGGCGIGADATGTVGAIGAGGGVSGTD